MLDEHLLNKSVRFAIVLVVMSLANLTDLGELRVAQGPAAIAEGLEGVLGLAGHDDVADEAEKIALAGRIGQIAGLAEHRAEDVLAGAHFRAEGVLVFLEHPLMLANAWNMAAAEVAEAGIVRLLLVILDGFEEGFMLHYCVVDLAFEEIESAVHFDAPFRGKRSSMEAHRRPS